MKPHFHNRQQDTWSPSSSQFVGGTALRGCDMVVALNEATVQGHTLFGLNHHSTRPMGEALCIIPKAEHAPDEVVPLANLTLPEVRHSFSVLGCQAAGEWGLTHGINEHRVAAGLCCWQSKLPAAENGLLGSELVRLALQRSQSARQAFDVLTSLVARHGQRGCGLPGAGDSIFLLADPKEAFVVETLGCHWAMLECQQVRAVSDVGLIRQDWRRLAPGLAELAVAQGWWTDDGSKLDVANSLAAPVATQNFGPLKRWGKATVALEQQSGDIDPHVLRLMLAEHFDLIAPAPVNGSAPPLQWLSSFIALLPSDPKSPAVAWYAFGPASLPLYFPILLDGELPPALMRHLACDAPLFARLQELLATPEQYQSVKDMLDRLQGHFDQQLDDFLAKARAQCLKEDQSQVERRGGIFMQNLLEMLEAELRRLPSFKEKTLAVQSL